jgi:ADP-ribose pyrophosphatase
MSSDRDTPDHRPLEPDLWFVDAPATAVLSAANQIGRGYRVYESYQVSLENASVTPISRDCLRSGGVVGVLPIDVERDEAVFVRQFRLGGHLALDRGSMVEIVAGRVDEGETPEQAAYRECLEEIGVAPHRLVMLLGILPAPALSDEHMTLFLAHVDASRVLSRAGAAHEQEETEPIRLPISTALEALQRGGYHSAPTVLALQWLALQRAGKQENAASHT